MAWITTLVILAGPGLLSILYFAGLAAGLGPQPWPVLVFSIAASLAAWWKLRPASPVPSDESWNWLLLAALAVAAIFVVLDAQTAAAANPTGEWDASGIWNMRARFLTHADTWRRAISTEPGSFLAEISHPAYPLFLSGFVAALWSAAGTYSAAVPAWFSIAAALGVLILLVTSVGPRSGALAGLILTATAYFASQASAQYSDLLLAFAFLAALTMLDTARDRPALIACGLAIGLAPWIKNEGQPFAIAALAVAVWRFRAGSVWVALGAVPGFAATLALKLMSDGRESMFPATVAQALERAADPARWFQVAAGFATAIRDAGPWWAHPVLLAIAVMATAGFLPRSEIRSRLWLAIPLAATFAAEFGIYVITSSDLAWHLSTSVTRLFLQLWPATLWFAFSLLRAPIAPPPAEIKRAKRKKQPALS